MNRCAKRQLRIMLVAVTVLCALASSTAIAATVPVLGWKGAFSFGKGFGAVKPRTVYLGGDPTGLVKSISWPRWGTRGPWGYGTGWCPGSSVASGHPCQAALRASNLGLCHGQRAYRKLAFYFKTGPGWTSGAKWNICRGAVS